MDPDDRRSIAEIVLKTIVVIIVIAIVGFGLLLGMCGLMFR